MDSYNGDIRFDNIYISTYFCQIDERRKKLVSGPSLCQGHIPGCPVASSSRRVGGAGEEALSVPRCVDIFSQGKRSLLPLRKAEKKAIIFPYDPSIQASEMGNVVRMAGGH